MRMALKAHCGIWQSTWRPARWRRKDIALCERDCTAAPKSGGACVVIPPRAATRGACLSTLSPSIRPSLFMTSAMRACDAPKTQTLVFSMCVKFQKLTCSKNTNRSSCPLYWVFAPARLQQGACSAPSLPQACPRKIMPQETKPPLQARSRTISIK